MPTNMDITSLVKAADLASQKSDRWLFIALLIVFGLTLWYVGRCFVKRYEELLKEKNLADEKHESNMKAIVDAQQKTITDLAVVLTKNTEALSGCMIELQQQAKQRETCQRIQDDFRRMAVK